MYNGYDGNIGSPVRSWIKVGHYSVHYYGSLLLWNNSGWFQLKHCTKSFSQIYISIHRMNQISLPQCFFVFFSFVLVRAKIAFKKHPQFRPLSIQQHSQLQIRWCRFDDQNVYNMLIAIRWCFYDDQNVYLTLLLACASCLGTPFLPLSPSPKHNTKLPNIGCMEKNK